LPGRIAVRKQNKNPQYYGNKEKIKLFAIISLEGKKAGNNRVAFPIRSQQRWP
jgi:hypothetical protein